MNTRKKILICPLDWGLGHATRCIPLVKYLLESNCEVMVAGDLKTNRLIQEACPEISGCIDIKGYNIRYAASKWLLPFAILTQLPGVLNVIRYEHHLLQHLIRRYHFDLVISDNRYGLYTRLVPSVFITHQLQIAVPQSRWLEKIVNKINHSYIRKFSEVWVPDYDDHAMAGKLSYAGDLKHVNYIGNLSRFEKATNTETLYDKIILLSGPEPQRTLLENLVMAQLSRSPERVLIVRGKPGEASFVPANKNIQFENHLTKNELRHALLQSEMIICRSGYSTILDLIKLNRNALLIPTPGQTEQEYLGAYLSEKKWFLMASQNNLDLQKETLRMKQFQFSPFPEMDMELYKKMISHHIAPVL